MPYFGVKINISPVLLSGKHGSSLIVMYKFVHCSLGIITLFTELTALFRVFSSHRQPSASLTKLFPSWTRLLAELDKPFPGVDHEGRQTFWLITLLLGYAMI